jgi:hypothetical protein
VRPAGTLPRVRRHRQREVPAAPGSAAGLLPLPHGQPVAATGAATCGPPSLSLPLSACREAALQGVVRRRGVLLTTYGMVLHNAELLAAHRGHDPDEGPLWDVMICGGWRGEGGGGGGGKCRRRCVAA